jgi:protein phosphatase
LKEPFAKGMGTTLVLLLFHNEGVTAAHCGDSRIYHFRNGRIIWRTMDHTPVNDLVRQGIITAEEALQRPKSNRITRAIQGYSVHRSLPDIQLISDILPGDIFFLCSDGVYETLSDNNLSQVFASENTLSQKMEIIKNACESHSGDNYSGYLIEIKSAETEPVKKNRFSYFRKFAKNDD